ncbi:DUF2262 domain-containing protein [Ruminococcus albus]|uniref:DUF2262 domain-containing protein n=1 Tax=Ruminococcus albus TaxID=1264 RepID=A0A1H7HUA0_RUMAL|nr:DUF2262 domain-containing protein [Ruminococcus albus]SEK53881.1 hypothetical protein SAMN05216469_103100 [Ruminococcus albus]
MIELKRQDSEDWPFVFDTELWGEKLHVEVNMEDIDVTDDTASEILPEVERAVAFVNSHKAEIIAALIDDGALDLADDWAASAEEDPDEENCYIMEDGQKVRTPISEEVFRDMLHINEAGLEFYDDIEEISNIQLYLTCDPDIFAGHAFDVRIDSEGNIEVCGLCG